MTDEQKPDRRRSIIEWFEPLLLSARLERARRAPLRRGSPGWTALRGADEMARSARFLRDMPGRERSAYALLVQAARGAMTALALVADDSAPPRSSRELWQRFGELPTGVELIAALPAKTRSLVEQLWDQEVPEDGWTIARRRDRRERTEALELFVRRLLAAAQPAADTPAAVMVQRLVRWALLVALVFAVTRGTSSLVRYLRSTPNRALFKPVEASSQYSTRRFPKDGLTDGLTDRLGCHTREQLSPWVRIDLLQPYDISKVVVINRPGRFYDRAVPLIVEVSLDGKSFDEIARRTTPFNTWAAEFAPVSARHVRLKVDAETTLHLQEVEVY